jgi:gluconolactonase
LKLDPQRTALLVIDLQNDTVGEQGAFASSGAAAFAKEHDVVAKAARLADAFRDAGAHVIHVWHVDERGHKDSTRNAELYRSIAEADALVRGTWGVEPVVRPREGDAVVEKQRVSSFNSTTLDTKLRGLGATCVV